jgi:hypothetical protein
MDRIGSAVYIIDDHENILLETPDYLDARVAYDMAFENKDWVPDDVGKIILCTRKTVVDGYGSHRNTKRLRDYNPLLWKSRGVNTTYSERMSRRRAYATAKQKT